MLTPKIIHYCWFGKKPLPPLAQQCLSSWRQYCPDYEIILWDESNSSKYFNTFCEQALREKQYAFVADCVRVKALQEFGGFYLDTDMLLVKPIDELRKYKFFSAYEVPGRVAYGFFGGQKQHRFFNLMADFYDKNYFNRYSLPVITHTFKAQIQDDNLQEGELLFPPEFCYPMPYEQRDEDPQQFVLPKTYGIHLWDHSWNPDKKESLWWLLIQFLKVHQDYYFYKYPKAYLRRYRKGFARRIYHKLIGKSSA
jgi:mannosyltransferase OCH1-like enzyme